MQFGISVMFINGLFELREGQEVALAFWEVCRMEVRIWIDTGAMVDED